MGAGGGEEAPPRLANPRTAPTAGPRQRCGRRRHVWERLVLQRSPNVSPCTWKSPGGMAGLAVQRGCRAGCRSDRCCRAQRARARERAAHGARAGTPSPSAPRPLSPASPERLPSVSRACRAPWLRLLRVRSAPAREAEDAHGPAGEVGAAVPSGFWPCWCLDGQKEALPRARLAAFVRASSLGSLGRARGLDWPLPAPWPLTRSSHPPAAGGDGPVQLREGRLAWLLRPEGCGPRAPFRCRWGPAWLLGPTAVAVFHLFEAPVRVGLHSPPPPWEAGLLATTLLLRRPHTCAGDCAPGPVMKS